MVSATAPFAFQIWYCHLHVFVYEHGIHLLELFQHLNAQRIANQSEQSL